MAKNTQKVGWIGLGRMGYPMAERLLKAGYDVSIWNRTREKAEPLGKLGGKVVDKAADLAGVDVLFSMVSTGKDLEQVYFGKDGALTIKGRAPAVLVDCSTISVEQSAALRKRVNEFGADFVVCPVSGNAKVIKAGKLSAVASGPEPAFRKIEDMATAFAPRGISYVGDGELARVCKIAHIAGTLPCAVVPEHHANDRLCAAALRRTGPCRRSPVQAPRRASTLPAGWRARIRRPVSGSFVIRTRFQTTMLT